MNIKDVAQRSGLPAKTIRYYEEIGLIRPLRAANGYRAFRETDLHKLTFLSRARSLGFSIEECRTLLALYEDHSRASADVKAVAKAHLAQIADKIAELRAMEATLTDLVRACAGDARPDCPILTGLEAGFPGKPGASVAGKAECGGRSGRWSYAPVANACHNYYQTKSLTWLCARPIWAASGSSNHSRLWERVNMIAEGSAWCVRPEMVLRDRDGAGPIHGQGLCRSVRFPAPEG